MGRPSRETMMSSVSTKQRPRRRARSRPQADFPAPMNPTRMTLSAGIAAILTSGGAGSDVAARLDPEDAVDLPEAGQQRHRHQRADQPARLAPASSAWNTRGRGS